MVGNVISPTTLTGDISLYGATPGVALFAKVLLILGVFIFIKKAPSMITDMFGIKGGSFKLGIRDKIKEAAFIGKPMVAGINAGIGAATGAIGAGYSFLKHKGQIPGDHSLKDAMAVGAKSGAAKGKNQFAGQRDNLFNIMTGKQGKDTIWGDFSRDAKAGEISLRKKYKGSYEEYVAKAENDYISNAVKVRLNSPETEAARAAAVAQAKDQYVSSKFEAQQRAYIDSRFDEVLHQNQRMLDNIQYSADFLNLKERVLRDSIKNNERLTQEDLIAKTLNAFKSQTDDRTARAIEEALDNSGKKLRERLAKEFVSENASLKETLAQQFDNSQDRIETINKYNEQIANQITHELKTKPNNKEDSPVVKALKQQDKMYADAVRYVGSAARAEAQADIVAALKKLQKDGKLANEGDQKSSGDKK